METTANTTAMVLYMMTLHPTEAKKVKEEILKEIPNPNEITMKQLK